MQIKTEKPENVRKSYNYIVYATECLSMSRPWDIYDYKKCQSEVCLLPDPATTALFGCEC